jgi:hypothetical protein
MKKLFILLTVLYISTTTQAYAQANPNATEDPHFGFKVGLNRSNIYDKQGEEFVADPKLGWVLGAFFSIPAGEYLGFQPELLYSQKGFTANGKILGTNYSFTRTTGYIDIPLQLQLKPSESLSIIAGPQYSFLINKKDVFTSGSTSTQHEQDIQNDNIRKNILGIVGGLDVNINRAVISGRAGWDLQHNNGDGTSTLPRYKNAWLQLTLGFKL